MSSHGYEYEPDYVCGSTGQDLHKFSQSSLQDLHRLHTEKSTPDSKLIRELIEELTRVKKDYGKAVILLDQHLPLMERLRSRLVELEEFFSAHKQEGTQANFDRFIAGDR